MSNLLFSKGRKYSVKMQNGRRKSFFASGDHGFFIFLLLYIRKLKGSFNANFLVWTVSQIDLLPCQFLIFSPTFSLVKKLIRVIPLGQFLKKIYNRKGIEPGFVLWSKLYPFMLLEGWESIIDTITPWFFISFLRQNCMAI